MRVVPEVQLLVEALPEMLEEIRILILHIIHQQF
jgi:hypothetical protein